MPRQTPAPIILTDQENLLPRPQLILTITVIGLIIAIANLDANGLSTALPTIATDLHAQQSVSWAGTSSLIASTVASVLYGRLSDVFGRRPLFVGACAVFAAAELVCGCAPSAAVLYVGRAITGLAGAGGLANLAAIVAADIVALEDRGKYQGYCGAFVAVGNVAGPFLAAAFADRATWRAFFWMLSPLGLICALCAWLFLPPTRSPGRFIENIKKVDWVGSFTSTTAIVLFLIPISGGGSYYAWDSPLVISMLCIASAAFIAFIIWEVRFARLPLIPMSVFRQRSVSALLAQAFVLGWTFQSSIIFLPLYFQNLRGYSAIVSAALLTPIIGTSVVISVSSGRYISKTRHYGGVIRLGTVAGLVGSALMIIFDRSTPPEAIVFVLIPVGIGAGSTGQPLIVGLQAHTKKSFRAVITSCRSFFRLLGASCGVAVCSAILQTSLRRALPPQYAYIASSVYSLPVLTPNMVDDVAPAYEKALRDVFIANAALSAVAVVLCLLWKDEGLQRREDKGEKTGEDNGEPACKASTDQQEPHEERDPEKGVSTSDSLQSEGPKDVSIEESSNTQCEERKLPR